MSSSDYEALVFIFDPTQLILTVCSVVSLVLTVASCVCCRRVKFREGQGVRAVNRRTVSAASFADAPLPHSVECRSNIRVEKVFERHSQPAIESDRTASDVASARASVPLQTGRALPKLPLDMYTAICKTRRANVAFTDEDGNPTYESIDPENDSLIDPFYFKLGEMTTSRPERKYDYPVFCGRKATTLTQADEGVVYQSASQIYTICGSEDPYSSITSDPPRSTNLPDRVACVNSAYQSGLLKSEQDELNAAWLKERLERTEMEVDQLYSKIRRASLPIIDDVNSNPETAQAPTTSRREGLIAPVPLSQYSKSSETDSVSSREPSYRYITVRENADVIRERLRLQGQLAPPSREHYYSVIGNEYETVSDARSTYAYGTVDSSLDHGILNITTAMMSELAPPPPTSPIPDRSASTMGSMILGPQQPSSSNDYDGVTSLYSIVSKPRNSTVIDNSIANDILELHPHCQASTSATKLEVNLSPNAQLLPHEVNTSPPEHRFQEEPYVEEA